LTEVAAGFELYGGEAQIGLGRVAGGAAGFLLVGARVDASGGPGAAVWHSTDGKAFTLVDSDPALESDARGSTEVDAAAVGPSGFVAVGGITPPHNPQVQRDPIAWHSADGLHWSRIAFPATPTDDLLQQVTLLPDGSAVAVGTASGQFAAWRSDAALGNWHEVARFGATAPDTSNPPGVESLVTAPAAAFAVVSDGTRYQLFAGAYAASPGSNSSGAWRPVNLPAPVSSTPVASGPRIVSAAGTGKGLLLGLDDGVRASVWVTDLP
jgi:hypothetical protein